MYMSVDIPKQVTDCIVLSERGLVMLPFPVVDWDAWVKVWTDALMPTRQEQVEYAVPDITTCKKCELDDDGIYTLCRKHQKVLMQAHYSGTLPTWVEGQRNHVCAICSRSPYQTALALLALARATTTQVLVITTTHGGESRIPLPPVITRSLVLSILSEYVRVDETAVP